MNFTLLNLQLNGLMNRSPFISKTGTGKFSNFFMNKVEVRNSLGSFLDLNKLSGRISHSLFKNIHNTAVLINTQIISGETYLGVVHTYSTSASPNFDIQYCTYQNCYSGTEFGAAKGEAILNISHSLFITCGQVNGSTTRGGGVLAQNTLYLMNVTFNDCRAIQGAAFYVETTTAEASFSMNGVTILSCSGDNYLGYISTQQTAACDINSLLVQSSTLSNASPVIISVTCPNSQILLQNSRFELATSIVCLDVVQGTSVNVYNTNFTTSTTNALSNLISSTTVTQYNFSCIQVYSPGELGTPLFSIPTNSQLYASTIVVNSSQTATTIALVPTGTYTISNTFSTYPLTVYISFDDPNLIERIDNNMLILPFTFLQGWPESTYQVTPGIPVGSESGTTPTDPTSPSSSPSSSSPSSSPSSSSPPSSSSGSSSSGSSGPVPTVTPSPSSSGSGLSTLEIVLIVILVIIVVFGLFAAIFICVRMHQGSMIDERTDPTQRPPVFP